MMSSPGTVILSSRSTPRNPRHVDRIRAAVEAAKSAKDPGAAPPSGFGRLITRRGAAIQYLILTRYKSV